MKWKPERADKSDLPLISQYFKEQFQGPARYGRADLFSWKTFDNPIQQGFIYLIKNGDVIAATTSVVPKRLILNKKQISAAEVGDTYTSPVYKREGLFAILGNACRKQAQDEGVQVVYGCPNNLALPGYKKRANFKVTQNLNIRSLVFPLSAKLKFQNMVGWYLAEVLNTLYRMFARIYIAAKRPAVNKMTKYLLEEVDSIPADWDIFWLKAAKKYEFIFDRSEISQNWRYFKNPEKYSFITVRHQNKLIGYCVYRNVIIDQGQDTIIADYLFLNDHEPALNLCLDQIFDNSFRGSIRSLNVWCDASSPYFTIFKNRGLKDQNKIPVIFHCENLYREIESVKNKHFTIGDSDNV
jgi:hypothetical protein